MCGKPESVGLDLIVKEKGIWNDEGIEDDRNFISNNADGVEFLLAKKTHWYGHENIAIQIQSTFSKGFPLTCG